jgi:dipeptidyl-peptidase-4
MHVKPSPDATQVGFVRGGNLYVRDLESGAIRALTHDGSDTIFNGDPDWVYEEELEFYEAWWWAPDSRHIAYLHTDASAIGSFPLVTTGESSYPELSMLPYPKAGSDNSTVTLRVVEVGTAQTQDVITLGSNDGYVARVHWAADGKRVLYQWVDRDQQLLELRSVVLSTGELTLLWSEASPEGWVEVTSDLRVLDDGRVLLSGENDGYRHLYLVDEFGAARQVDRGEWEIRGIDHVAADGSYAIVSTSRHSHLRQSIERIQLDDGSVEALIATPGWHNADVSPDGRYIVDTFSSETTRQTMHMHNADGSRVRTLVADDMSAFEDIELAERRFYSFETEGGDELFASLLVPADFDESRRYPVVMYVYGGPGSQRVRESWDSRGRELYHRLLAQDGFLVFIVDGRGTGGRGRDFKTVVSRRLGQLEIEDQLAGVAHLKSLPYVDGDHIGIWGWSYGGYVSGLSIFRDEGELAAAIAVSPVSDWRFYDTIYTERYMGTPDQNAEGYDAGSLLNEADGLEAPFLLIHGMADDNVHPQNSMRLVSALQDAGKDFQLMVYPNKAHSIAGAQTRLHLYTTMRDFWHRHLLPVQAPAGR